MFSKTKTYVKSVFANHSKITFVSGVIVGSVVALGTAYVVVNFGSVTYLVIPAKNMKNVISNNHALIYGLSNGRELVVTLIPTPK